MADIGSTSVSYISGPTSSNNEYQTKEIYLLDQTISSFQNVSDTNNPCSYENVYERLSTLFRVVVVIAAVLTAATLLMIAFHRRLRKQHNIFRFNVVFANLLYVSTECLLETAPDSFWKHESARFFFRFILETSIMVSMASISMVAIYQYISILIDPFGAKNILTTPRCITACVVCWITMFTMALIYNVIYRTKDNFLSPSFATVVIVIIGLCYVLIYRSISRAGSVENVLSQQRVEENRRVMLTHGFVFTSALILCVLPEWLYVGLNLMDGSGRNYHCVRWFWGFTPVLHSIANPLIYWWRLKEFRDLLPANCKRNTVSPRTDIVL